MKREVPTHKHNGCVITINNVSDVKTPALLQTLIAMGQGLTGEHRVIFVYTVKQEAHLSSRSSIVRIKPKVLFLSQFLSNNEIFHTFIRTTLACQYAVDAYPFARATCSQIVP